LAYVVHTSTFKQVYHFCIFCMIFIIIWHLWHIRLHCFHFSRFSWMIRVWLSLPYFVTLGWYSRCMVLVYKPVIAVLLVPRCSHCALSDIVMYSTIRYSLKFCYLHNYSFIHLCLYVIFELDSEDISSRHVDPSFVTFFMYKWCVNILSFIGTFISSLTFVPLLHCDVVIIVNGFIYI
jgi:hypothetical protein